MVTKAKRERLPKQAEPEPKRAWPFDANYKPAINWKSGLNRATRSSADGDNMDVKGTRPIHLVQVTNKRRKP